MQFVVCRVSRRTELNDSEGFVIDMLVLSEWDETLKLKKKKTILKAENLIPFGI